MKAFITILILFSTIPVLSQTVSYTYDAAGNCTARTVAPAKAPQAPQPQVPEEEKTQTALPDIITESDFLIYPNPTQGHFTVEINNLPHDMKGEACLYDSNGRIVEKRNIHSHNLHDKLDFNLSHKSAGMYILNIRLENSAFTWKIVKK